MHKDSKASGVGTAKDTGVVSKAGGAGAAKVTVAELLASSTPGAKAKLFPVEWCQPDFIFSSDACLSGCGGFWQGNYFHSIFPEFILRKNLNINILEMLSIIICLKIWGKYFKGKRIQIFCDNEAVCQVISSGRAKCELLQSGLREIAFLTATLEFEIKTVHLDSKSNRISDFLSRYHLSPSYETQFMQLTSQFNLNEYKVSADLFTFINTW